KAVQPGIIRCGQDVLFPILVFGQFGSDLVDDIAHFVDISFIGDADVEVDAGVLHRHVSRLFDAAIGNVVDIAIKVAKHRNTHGDFLDGAAHAVELNDVTDTVLVFKYDKHTGNEILNKVLGAKTNGETGHTGTSQQRADFKSELAQEHHDGDE